MTFDFNRTSMFALPFKFWDIIISLAKGGYVPCIMFLAVLVIEQHHTIIRAAFVCVFVCFLSPPRSFGRSSPNFVGVCRWTSHLPLRGSFSKRSRG